MGKQHRTIPTRIIYCPTCHDVLMPLASVTPLLLSFNTQETHYECRKCGTREIEFVRPDDGKRQVN